MVWPPFIVARPVPVIVRHAWPAKPRAVRQHSVGIVETNQPIAVRIVQRERVAQPMRTFLRRHDPLDLEFQPVAVFEMMNAAIKRQQKLQCVLV